MAHAVVCREDGVHLQTYLQLAASLNSSACKKLTLGSLFEEVPCDGDAKTSTAWVGREEASLLQQPPKLGFHPPSKRATGPGVHENLTM